MYVVSAGLSHSGGILEVEVNCVMCYVLHGIHVTDYAFCMGADCSFGGPEPLHAFVSFLTDV